jgi:hypothetical protein
VYLVSETGHILMCGVGQEPQARTLCLTLTVAKSRFHSPTLVPGKQTAQLSKLGCQIQKWILAETRGMIGISKGAEMFLWSGRQAICLSPADDFCLRDGRCSSCLASLV